MIPTHSYLQNETYVMTNFRINLTKLVEYFRKKEKSSNALSLKNEHILKFVQKDSKRFFLL